MIEAAQDWPHELERSRFGRDPVDFLDRIVIPACDFVGQNLIRLCSSDNALVLMLAIAYQESGRLNHTTQMHGGPARGYWQFEGGHNQALDLIMRNPQTYDLALKACLIAHVPYELSAVHASFVEKHWLCAVFARLLLYLDHRMLPETDASNVAWAYYLRNWRPGKPNKRYWSYNHPLALATLQKFRYLQNMLQDELISSHELKGNDSGNVV
jgi:hypothetical protein